MTFNKKLYLWLIGAAGVFLVAYILAKLMAG